MALYFQGIGENESGRHVVALAGATREVIFIREEELDRSLEELTRTDELDQCIKQEYRTKYEKWLTL